MRCAIFIVIKGYLYFIFVSIITDIFLLDWYVQFPDIVRVCKLWYGDGILHCIYYHCVSYSRMLFWNFMPVFPIVVVFVIFFCIICFVKNPKSAGAPLALINNWRRRNKPAGSGCILRLLMQRDRHICLIPAWLAICFYLFPTRFTKIWIYFQHDRPPVLSQQDSLKIEVISGMIVHLNSQGKYAKFCVYPAWFANSNLYRHYPARVATSLSGWWP